MQDTDTDQVDTDQADTDQAIAMLASPFSPVFSSFGVDVGDCDGSTPLGNAADMGHLEVCRCVWSGCGTAFRSHS